MKCTNTREFKVILFNHGRSIMKITVIGAGNTGITMAGHASSKGHDVSLWNRNREEVPELFETKTVELKGVIEGSYTLYNVTTDMRVALKDTELVLITTPSFAHRDIAKLVAESLENDTTVILFPGRTFGVLEFIAGYKAYSNSNKVQVAETQTAIYTCRKLSDTQADLLSIKKNVSFSFLDGWDNERLYETLPDFLKDSLTPAKSLVETSIGNVGMMLHCAPLLLNAGWTENEDYSYMYYKEGITPRIARFIERLDEERLSVAKKFNQEIESVSSWVKRIYGVEGDNLYERIQNTRPYDTIEAPNSLDFRYITEDVPNGLVPLESAGKYLGLEMNYTSLVIDLASALLETDFRKNGRNLKDLFESEQEVVQLLFYRGED